ncbi:60S acidic ribosomal protein P1-like [Quillaja saponaria]|uniref:60S acidic ribosomal protein P1-like n=1 Tax=Quillaja saponaria TaxID=32244 RepID=A0AAD7PYV8_QUISA|nr:60S acidic ribosomal protein P1-like [Quillaja saponaria]
MLLCSLLLHDDGISTTAEKIATVVKAANLTIDSYWPGLFAKLFETRNIEDLILNIGSGGAYIAVATPPAEAGSAAAAASGPSTDEKKEEANEEAEEEDYGFSMFD